MRSRPEHPSYVVRSCRAAAKTADGTRLLRGLGVAAAVLVGVGLRLAVSSPLWLDEALSVNIASLPLADIGGALRSDGHPPLYYWLLHGWMDLVGDSDRASRSLSFVLGLAALPVGWMLGRRVGGRAAAAWTVVLLSVSPYVVRYSTEARMYSLVMLLVLLGGVLVLDALASPNGWRLAGIAAVSALLVYSQYWAFYLLASLLVVLAWRWWSKPDQRNAVVRVGAAVAAGGATFVLWLPAFLDQLTHTGTPWSLPARPTQVVADTLFDLGGAGLLTFSEGVLFGLLVAFLVAVSVLTTRPAPGEPAQLTAHGDRLTREIAVGRVQHARHRCRGGVRRQDRLQQPVRRHRGAPAARPRRRRHHAAAEGLADDRLCPRRGGARPGRAASRVATLDRTEGADLAAVIVERSEPGDAVLVCPDQVAVSLERALRDAGSDLPVYPYPDLDGDPRFVQWRDYEQRNDAADPAALAAEVDERVDGAVWLVTNASYRTFEGDCEQLAETLSELRGAAELARDQPSERAFEHADLLRFGSG